MPDFITGRLADADPKAEFALLPYPWHINVDSLGTGTHNWYLSIPAPGYLRIFMARTNLNGGTCTLDILKNGSSILAATQALTTNVARILEGLGTDTSGEDRDFNTKTAANIAKLKVAKGDLIQLQAVVATAASLGFNASFTFDLRQPRTKPDYS